MNFLDFEKPIEELKAKIDELRRVEEDTGVKLMEEVERLESKSIELTKSIFSALSPVQVVKLARHPQRPYTNDYIKLIFDDYDELQGDRHFSNGPSLVGGIARLNGSPIMVIGHQKGRGTNAKVRRNFGMPKPEGYRKALRLMKLAEKFSMPIVTFIDTPGAYPGIGAEERNQSEAIARNLFECSTLRVPIMCIVIGEGGSGGALAIGVGDRVCMLQYSIYSVISPEGCATILWRSADKAELAAEAMGVTPDRIHRLGIVDQIIEEPLGGAHRDFQTIANNIKSTIVDNLSHLNTLTTDELLEQRYQRLMSFGLKA